MKKRRVGACNSHLKSKTEHVLNELLFLEYIDLSITR